MEERRGVTPQQRSKACRPASSRVQLLVASFWPLPPQRDVGAKPPVRQQLCPMVPVLLETPVKHPLIQALFPAKLKQELTQKPSTLLHAASFTDRGLPLCPTQAGRGQGHGGAATSPSPTAPLLRDGTPGLRFLTPGPVWSCGAGAGDEGHVKAPAFPQSLS